MNTADKADWTVSSDARGEGPQRIPTSEFLADVYHMYSRNFWDLYKICLPPTLLSLVIFTARQTLSYRVIAGLPRGDEILQHRWAIVALWAVNLSAFFLAWFLEAFSFAAIADVIHNVCNEEPIPQGDGYVRARERVVAIAHVALGTYIRFILGFGLWQFFVSAAIIKVAPSMFSHSSFNMAMGVIVILILSAALMGYAFAIPMLVSRNVGARQAMRGSWHLTDGHEGKLFLLIAESVVGGIMGAYLASWAAFYVFQHVAVGEWGAWIATIASSLFAAAAQAPMLVGFSLLYYRVVTDHTSPDHHDNSASFPRLIQ